jgi:hypothetical protein
MFDPGNINQSAAVPVVGDRVVEAGRSEQSHEPRGRVEALKFLHNADLLADRAFAIT